MTELSASPPVQTPEIKAMPAAAPSSQEVVDAFDDFMEAFEAFKATNDERLREIESRVGGDPLSEEKLDRINRTLDEQKQRLERLSVRQSRPALATETKSGWSDPAHREAFEQYIRSGRELPLQAWQEKSLSVGVSADGGFLVPHETENEIGRRLSLASPIRQVATVRRVSSGTYKKPFSSSGPAFGWVGETDARTETTAPKLEELTFPAKELYAMPAATMTLLDDAVVNIDDWIADEVQTVFAEQESKAFVTGTADNEPKGFMSATTVAEASWTWGNIGYLLTGKDAGFDDTIGADCLIDLIFSLKAGYRQNAHWVMNRKTQAAVRKLKDEDGAYLWRPAATAEGSATLMNFPILESEHMPDIATDNMAIAFGDFKRGYLIVDRLGVRVLRDPYSNKPYVMFYTTKRVGGGIQDYDAIKFLKFGAS